MAIIFSITDEGCFTLRKGLFRMLLSRAEKHVAAPADKEQLLDYNEGVSLFRMTPDERQRIGNALLHAAISLRGDVAIGRPTEEPILSGASQHLTELIAFLSSHLRSGT